MTQFHDAMVQHVVNAIENGHGELARGNVFTVDDLWDIADRENMGDPPHNRTMGYVITRLSKLGMIRRTDRSVKSKRHDGRVTVWKVQ